MSTPPLFLVDALPLGTEGVLDGAEGRHAATVRRLRVDEELVLADGRGGLARCAVNGVEPGRLRVRVLAREQVAAPRLRVVVVQALVKGDRGELAVELATEAGADEVVPWRAARCVARWDDGARGGRALGRWRGTAREAAKQARRPWVPDVTDPVDTTALAHRIRQAAAALVLHESAPVALSRSPLPAAGELLVVIGPEGGITGPELATVVGAGAVAVRLGPAVLRASTAAVVALGALGALTERW